MKRRSRMSREQMAAALAALAARLGRVPTWKEITRCRRCPTPHTFARHFGSMSAARVAAGLPGDVYATGERNAEIRRRRASGETMQSIADGLGVSRQRVDQVLHPRRAGARTKLRAAVRAGAVARPETCQRCGKPGGIHGHHPDYGEPLDVEWLCTSCHGAEHAGAHRVERLRFTCPVCGRAELRLPSDPRRTCSPDCGDVMSARKLSRSWAARRARTARGRMLEMASRLRSYAADVGYVPVLSEFLEDVYPGKPRTSRLAALRAYLDPSHKVYNSYANAADKLYIEAGLGFRPDGRKWRHSKHSGPSFRSEAA